MVGGIKQKVRRYSSSAGVNLHLVDGNGLSPKIGWGFGKRTKVIGAIGGLATVQGSLNVDGS